MSNGENVVDSWEEIDEADLEKSLQNYQTEQSRRSFGSAVSATSSIDRTIARPQPTMKLLQRPNASPAVAPPMTANDEISAFENMESTFKPVLMILHNTNDEYQSANYTAPIANQTVKILRRPTQQSEAERRNGMAKPKQPIKTLQQREQEYAEARLRIMGAAKNPEDDLANSEKLKKSPMMTTTTPVPTTTSKSTNLTPINVSKDKLDGNLLDQQLPLYNVMDTNGGVGLGTTNYVPHQLQQQQQYSPNYGYPVVPPCSDLYANRMTMMAMPPPPIQAQNYQHLNSGMFVGHQQMQQQQQQPRQYQKQFSVPMQPMPTTTAWPTIPQQSQNKVAYIKNTNNSNNNNNKKQANSIQTNETVVRVPRGPDGSQGFQMRR